jgi:DNA-binding transcriptional regulator PaaX
MNNRLVTKQVINGVLKLLLASGVGVSVVIAPNSAQVLAPLIKKLDKARQGIAFREVAYYMGRKQLIEYRECGDGSYELRLTNKGRRRAEQVDFDELTISKPRTWDGMWHLVLFDIPEYQRKARNALTDKLKRLGFYQLQKSAWIHPYPCEPVVSQVREAFAINPKSVVCSEIRAIDRQALLKRHFKLS